jgi:hypothetical protein
MRWASVLLFIALTSSAFGQTVDPTTHELLSIINERSKAVEQRFVDKERADAQRVDVQEKANNARFDAQEKAVIKAETAAEKRFDSVNEFRNTLKDQQITLMPRSEAMAVLKAMDDKIQGIDARVSQIVSRSEGAGWLWGIICGTGGLLAGIVVAYVALYRVNSPKRT